MKSTSLMLIAKCDGTTKNNLTSFTYKGRLHGSTINQIILKGGLFSKGSFYVLTFNNYEIGESILVGSTTKYKELTKWKDL